MISSRTHGGKYVNKCRGDRRSRKSRASEKADCDNLNLRGRNKVPLCLVLMLMNYLVGVITGSRPIHSITGNFNSCSFADVQTPAANHSAAERSAAGDISNPRAIQNQHKSLSHCTWFIVILNPTFSTFLILNDAMG